MDFESHFDEKYRKILEDIQNNFQRNINVDIERDIDRTIRDDFAPRQFIDAGFGIGEKSILLKNIAMNTRPDLSLVKFEVDFKNQCLYITFKFEHIQITTDYQLNSSCKEQANQNGSMKFNFNVIMDGQVGIFFNQDSYSPITYDVKYDIDSLKLEVTPPQENMECFNLDPNDGRAIETKVMSLFWPAVKDYLYYEIYKLVSGNVVDYSVSELLIDEPEHLKKYAEARIEHGNLIIDQCLRVFNNILEEQSNFCYTKGFSVNIQNDEFRCDEARLLKPVLKRTYNTSYTNNGKAEYYAHVILDQYQYGFLKSIIERGNEPFEGDVIVKPYRHKISFKITECNGKKRLSVEMIDILDWDFEVKPKNDVIQFFAENDLQPYLTGYVWHYTNEALQKCVEQFNMNN